MPSIKVTYFDMMGRAEALRLALAIGDIPFEDERIKREDWPQLKPNTPYGSVPIAHIDGEVAAQTGALLRYMGKIAGLYPESPLDALKVDEVLDTLEDALKPAFAYRGPDKEKLKESRETFVKEAVPRYYGGLEKRLEVFGKGPWACGDSITIADITIFSTITQLKSGFMEHVPADVVDQYPRIMESYNAVRDMPKVIEYYKN